MLLLFAAFETEIFYNPFLIQPPIFEKFSRFLCPLQRPRRRNCSLPFQILQPFTLITTFSLGPSLIFYKLCKKMIFLVYLQVSSSVYRSLLVTTIIFRPPSSFGFECAVGREYLLLESTQTTRLDRVY